MEGQMGTPFSIHPLRQALANEVHARPYAPLTAPVRVSHLAFLATEQGFARETAVLRDLCSRYGDTGPGPTDTHFAADFGPFRLKWERHNEFSTYTFFVPGPFTAPFAEPALGMVPRDWLAQLGGNLLVSVDVAFEQDSDRPQTPDDIRKFFAGNKLVGSRVAGGRTGVWTDFHLHDGASRFLVWANLNEDQGGRLVQRLLEIETYRMMALLALPLAREVTPTINKAERDLAAATDLMISAKGLEEERTLLKQLTTLSSEIETISAATTFRFGAARAYYKLVERRITNLREDRIEGLQTIREFMERRLLPAVQTCESVHSRQEGLARRIARATDLLRTRVDLTLEQQNRDLLASMDRRAKLQLRLQGTVEGLSTVAITYYLANLVGYLVEGLGESAPVEGLGDAVMRHNDAGIAK
jgi:uncharacterized membrane-anchored protein